MRASRAAGELRGVDRGRQVQDALPLETPSDQALAQEAAGGDEGLDVGTSPLPQALAPLADLRRVAGGQLGGHLWQAGRALASRACHGPADAHRRRRQIDPGGALQGGQGPPDPPLGPG